MNSLTKQPLGLTVAFFLSLVVGIGNASGQNLPEISGVFVQNRSSERLSVHMLFTFVGNTDGYTYHRLKGAGNSGVIAPGQNVNIDKGRFDLSKRYYLMIHSLDSPANKNIAWGNDTAGAKIDRVTVPNLPTFENLKDKPTAVATGRGDFSSLLRRYQSTFRLPATRIEPLGNHRCIVINYTGHGRANITVK